MDYLELIVSGITPLIHIVLIPLIMGFMYFFPPKKINHIYGYRTSRSMKNQENWDYAQKMSARVFIYGTIITTPFYFFANYIYLNFNNPIEHLPLVHVAILVISMILNIVYCEYDLKKFEENNQN